MSESAEVISNADASYGTDTETLPDVEVQILRSLEENQKKENSREGIIRETADNVQSCRVCYDEYHVSKNQARVLGCGHTFCTRCVINCSRPNDQNIAQLGIKCPECRKINEQAPATVPVNFQLMQILTALSLVKEVHDSDQEKELPNYENFERLGTQLPSEQLQDLSMNELFEHMKAVFNAMRIRCRRDKEFVKSNAQVRYQVETNKIDDVEKSMNRVVHMLTRLKNGEILQGEYLPWLNFIPNPNENGFLHDNDWMREMVVYRPPQIPQLPLRPAVTPPQLPAQPPIQDVDTVLEREQVARAEADPRRTVHVVREAYLRRERESAQEREAANRNSQLMRQILERRAAEQIIRGQPNMPPRAPETFIEPGIDGVRSVHQLVVSTVNREREEETVRRIQMGLPPLLADDDVSVDDDDSGSVASDDSSFIDEPVTTPPAPRPMTVGEAISVYRMVEVFSPRHLRLGVNSFILPNNHADLNALSRRLLNEHGSITGF
uniref:RING-type domain-containing protein n=1 Tax=Caenorhabditis tropicalis TaxID=1561998 RepID=A0A1I7UY76_9PELO